MRLKKALPFDKNANGRVILSGGYYSYVNLRTRVIYQLRTSDDCFTLHQTIITFVPGDMIGLWNIKENVELSIIV